MTDKIKITKAKAISAVRQAVKTEGRDHTAVCMYVNNGKPTCIVGQALFNLGVPIETLSDMPNGTIGYAYVSAALSDAVEITPKALDFLDLAQQVQDEGSSWGAALDEALNGRA